MSSGSRLPFTPRCSFWPNHSAFSSGEDQTHPFPPRDSRHRAGRAPLPKYGGDEGIISQRRAFPARSLAADYLANNGLPYPAVWSIGCPLHCTYCGNTVLHPPTTPTTARSGQAASTTSSGEVLAALKVHPYLKTVLFYDDSFLAISLPERLTDFARPGREEVGIEFCNLRHHPDLRAARQGRHPDLGRHESHPHGNSKRQRAIQGFYKRPTPVPRIGASGGRTG